MKIFLCVMLVVLATVHQLEAAAAVPKNTYYMQNTGSSTGKCGRSWSVRPDQTYTLISDGEAVNGSCWTSAFAVRSTRCNNEVCLALEEIDLPNNVVEITITDGNSTKTLSTSSDRFTNQCFKAKSGKVAYVKIHAVETKQYTKQWMDAKKVKGTAPTKYSFRFTLKMNCNGFDKSVLDAADKDSETYNTKEELEAARTMNYVHGIVVAICLASIFLVVLLITYCYYKNNPQGRRRPQAKLAETFAKEKKNVGEQVAKDRRVEGHYKKTETSELQPLVSAVAATDVMISVEDDHNDRRTKDDHGSHHDTHHDTHHDSHDSHHDSHGYSGGGSGDCGGGSNGGGGGGGGDCGGGGSDD